MSGVSRFVRGDQNGPNPQPLQRIPSPRPDRATIAKDARVSLNSVKRKPAAGISSTAPSTGYLSNNHPLGGRNTDPNQRYFQQEQVGNNHGPLNDTLVSSDFDVTKSEIQSSHKVQDYQAEEAHEYPPEERYNETDRYGRENEDDYDLDDETYRQQHLPPHPNHFKQGQTPIVEIEPVPEPEREGQFAPRISGRFYGQPGQPQQHQSNLQLRPGQNQNQHTKESRKRERSHESEYLARNHNLYQERPPQEEDEPEEDDLPERGRFTNSNHHRDQGGSPDNHVNSDGAESIASTESPSRPYKPRGQVRQSSQVQVGQPGAHVDPDYDDKTLKRMKYEELGKQHWDAYPNPPKSLLPENLQGPNITLGQRIEYYADPKNNKDLDAHAALYSQLSVGEWEQAGDFFVDKFAELMKKLRDARRNKRQEIAKFEAEIQKREKAVRGKSGKLDTELQGMKASGAALLRGKIV
jgi:hypothetical protein